MKASSRPLLLVFPLLALGLGCAGPGSPSEEVSTDTAETRKIPLDAIYSTSDQKPLKEVNPGFRHQPDGSIRYVEPYGPILEKLKSIGASNVFLARGDNIGEAIKATSRVFNQGEPVRQPVVSDRQSKSDKFWLVAFFGIEGSGPAWLVKSIEISAARIRVVYRWADAFLANDICSYYVWAPIGTLAPGTYTLELYDEGRGYVTFSRTVRVP